MFLALGQKLFSVGKHLFPINSIPVNIWVPYLGMGGGGSIAKNIVVSPVTPVNIAVVHLTLKLAALIFNQLNHSLLKCKLYLNLHGQVFFFQSTT